MTYEHADEPDDLLDNENEGQDAETIDEQRARDPREPDDDERDPMADRLTAAPPD